jgi:hypothetical protein
MPTFTEMLNPTKKNEQTITGKGAPQMSGM